MKCDLAFRQIGMGIGLLACQLGEAAEIRVQVTDRNLGHALAQASVCLGTPVNPVQFGGQFTGENGYVIFENVPETRLVLTVSRPEYTGYLRNHPAKSFDITLLIGLTAGGSGPVCDLGEAEFSAAVVERSLTIPVFRLGEVASSSGGRTVRLEAVTTGNPTHYRVAEHWAFKGAEWIDYTTQPSYKLSAGAGEKRVYFQVRRLKQFDGGKMESLSGIAGATIQLEP
jgi:hypothetical protein